MQQRSNRRARRRTGAVTNVEPDLSEFGDTYGRGGRGRGYGGGSRAIPGTSSRQASKAKSTIKKGNSIRAASNKKT